MGTIFLFVFQVVCASKGSLLLSIRGEEMHGFVIKWGNSAGIVIIGSSVFVPTLHVRFFCQFVEICGLG